MKIDVTLARQLISDQFHEWENLDIRPVEKSGHDNRTFHLGDKMAIRLPSGPNYAAQVEKENQWLPYLQEHLTYPISKPIAVGKPTPYYPFPWSVNHWIEADVLRDEQEVDEFFLAKDLAEALRMLQQVPCQQGPKTGEHNFYRGGSLKVYHAQTMEALEQLKEELPVNRLEKIWKTSLAQEYTGKDVWVHGDIAPGNILMKSQRFYGLIDFGILGIGDPACDYAMAWTYFHLPARHLFLSGLDQATICRARGWALWKALITYHDADEMFKQNAHETIEAILQEHEIYLDD